MSGEFWNGDCLELMKNIPDGSVDMILCDLPYGTTACKWDSIIPFEPLWEQYWRVAKPNAAIVLTAAQPFTTALIYSQMDKFKYCWVWNKDKAGNFATAKKQPLRVTEDVCVFSNKPHQYFPLMEKADDKNKRPRTTVYKQTQDSTFNKLPEGYSHSEDHDENVRYPKNLINIKSTEKECNNINRIHPTQKPVALFEYLIKTYTNEGETVLDNTAGSGTTAIAAINTNRNWICIEKDEEYYSKACARIAKHQESLDTPKLEID
jgi:site-specific DNA-methyltransferase (adenine-specific)